MKEIYLTMLPWILVVMFCSSIRDIIVTIILIIFLPISCRFIWLGIEIFKMSDVEYIYLKESYKSQIICNNFWRNLCYFIL